MAYAKVEETFWHDPKVRALSERGRNFFLYLLTSPHRNRIGCFVLDPFYAAADIQWSPEQVCDALQELEEADRVTWDREHRVVLLRRFLKYNVLENGKVVIAAIRELSGVPDTPLLADVMESLERYRKPHYRPLIDALTNRLTNGIPNGMGYGHETRAETGSSDSIDNGIGKGMAFPGPGPGSSPLPGPGGSPWPDEAPGREPGPDARAGSASPHVNGGNPERHPLDAFVPTEAHQALARELGYPIAELLTDWRLHRKANGITPADPVADFELWIRREPDFANGNGAHAGHEPPGRVTPPVYVSEPLPEITPEERRAGLELVKQAVAASRSVPMPPAEIDDPETVARREANAQRQRDLIAAARGRKDEP